MDISSLCSTRIQKSFDDDQATILRTFLNTDSEGAKVYLTNYYKELPISHPATILAVGTNTADLEVSSQQAFAMATDGYTLIRSHLFPDPILAHVQYVRVKKQVSKQVASLNKFCFVEVLADKRVAVRVNLEPPVDCTILSPNQYIPGKLVDISVNGLAITVDDFVDIKIGTEIPVEFILSDHLLLTETTINLVSELVQIYGEASPYYYRFKIFPDNHQEQLVSRYIFQRQIEIIQDIKKIIS